MDDKLINNLVKARTVLKEKLRTLRADIAKSQRDIDIPLQEIAVKLGSTIPKQSRTPHSKDAMEDTPDTWSEIFPEKSYAAVQGTSIIRQGTPSRKHVSWFSPYTHSSPTKRKLEGVGTTPRTSKVLATLDSEPDAPTPKMSTSFTQPTFLEDDYIGHLLPETPEGREEDESKEDETDTSGSMDLDKSMAHAVSLLSTRPAKSIIANKSLNKTLLETDEVKESLRDYDRTIRPYLIGLMTDENDEFDEKYGVHEVGGDLKIGNNDVRFDGPNIIIGEFTYRATKGLLELLFMKRPGKFQYADAKNYKFILNDTHAARVDYDPARKYAASKYYKYTTIIKPIVQGKKPEVWWTRTWKTGLGLSTKLPLRKIVVPKSIVEYKYWDDVNELCDRLKLLMASKDAGHTGHDNEITAIIEELQESKIIK